MIKRFKRLTGPTPAYSGPKSAYNLLGVVKKSEVRKVVYKTFNECKSVGVKKLRVRAAES